MKEFDSDDVIWFIRFCQIYISNISQFLQLCGHSSHTWMYQGISRILQFSNIHGLNSQNSLFSIFIQQITYILVLKGQNNKTRSIALQEGSIFLQFCSPWPEISLGLVSGLSACLTNTNSNMNNLQ